MISDKATASSGVSGGSTGGSTGEISEINSENPLDLSDDSDNDQEYEGLTFDEAYEYCSSLGLGLKMMY